jgi:hypothetical protein
MDIDLANQIHMPTGSETLAYCKKQLPRFEWEILRDTLEQVYVEGIFTGKIFRLIVRIDICPDGAMAWVSEGTNPLARSHWVRSLNEKGIPYQRALAEVVDGLITLSEDAHNLGLNNVFHPAKLLP